MSRNGLTTNYDLINASIKYNLPLFDVVNKDRFKDIWKKVPLNYGVVINLADSGNGGTLNGSHATPGSHAIPGSHGTLNGSHWVAIFKTYRFPYYFDSFGTAPPEIVKKTVKSPIYYSKEEIQSKNSTICGYYCLYFLYCMSIGMSFNDFLDQFNLTDPKKNLKILKEKFKVV